MKRVLFLMTTLVVMFLEGSFSKPMEITTKSNTLNTIALVASNSVVSDAKRVQRSPQYGLSHDYGNYYGYNSRQSPHGYRRPVQKYYYRPSGTYNNGCRGYHCGGGSQPSHQAGGASFASAAAGSIGGGGWPFNGQSQSTAQSASFNFGPFSASISSAQSSSLGRK